MFVLCMLLALTSWKNRTYSLVKLSGRGAVEKREIVNSTGSSALNDAHRNLVRHSTMKQRQWGKRLMIRVHTHVLYKRRGSEPFPHKWNSVYNGYLQRAGGVSLSPRKWNFVYNRHFFSHHKQLAMMLWLWSFEVSLPAKAPPNSVEPCSIPHWPHPLLVRVCVPETKQKSTWKSHLNEGFFTDLLLKWWQCCSVAAASLPWEWRNLTTSSQKKIPRLFKGHSMHMYIVSLPTQHINFMSPRVYKPLIIHELIVFVRME